MSQFSEQAEAVQVKLDVLRAELHATLAQAGSHVREMVSEGGSAADGGPLVELAQRDADVDGQIATVESQRDRIREIEDGLAGAKERIGELKAEVRDLSENLEPIYEEIGRIAFEVYRSNPLVDEEYAAIFSPLVEVNSELSGIDAAMAEQQTLLEEKPFLEKMVVRGKIALLKNRRATREGTFRRLARSAGSDIMGTAFVDEISDPRLVEAAEPYRDRLRSTRDLEAEIDALKGNQQNLEKELEGVCAGKRLHKRLEELADDALTLTRTRDAIRVEMAEAVRGKPKTELPAECRTLFKQADAIEKRLAGVQLIADRLKAAAAVEQLEGDEKQVQAELSRKENRLAELKKEIAELKKKRAAMTARLQEQLEVRGATDDLLAENLLDNL